MARDDHFCYAINNYGKQHVWAKVWEGKPDGDGGYPCDHCTMCGASRHKPFDGTYDALTCWLDFGIKNS